MDLVLFDKYIEIIVLKQAVILLKVICKFVLAHSLFAQKIEKKLYFVFAVHLNPVLAVMHLNSFFQLL